MKDQETFETVGLLIPIGANKYSTKIAATALRATCSEQSRMSARKEKCVSITIAKSKTFIRRLGIEIAPRIASKKFTKPTGYMK